VALQAHFGFADFATFKHLTVRAPQGVRTSRSAAIRQLDDDGQGARRAGLKAKSHGPHHRKDASHPKYQSHGRIAGR